MSNRAIAAERYVTDYHNEAMRIVERARLQREAARGAGGVLVTLRQVLSLGKEVTHAAIRGGTDLPRRAGDSRQ